MKKAIKWILYLVVVLLVLEIVKTIIEKQQLPVSYIIAVIIGSLQTCLLLAFLIIPLLYRLFQTMAAFRNKAWMPAVITFVVIVAALEYGCLYGLHHPASLPAFLKSDFVHYYYLHDRKILQYSSSSIYDPTTFYTLQPDARFNFNNAEFETHYSINSGGMRDDEGSLQKPSIICLGDSYTVGWGVEQEQTFSALVEKKTGKTVLNAGMSSYGTAREMIRLRNLDTSGLQVLMIQYCSNDYQENTEYLKHDRVLPVSTRAYFEETVKAHRLSRTYYPGKCFLTIVQLFVKRQVNRIYPVFRLEKEDDTHKGSVADQAKAFLEVLYNAPVDFTRIQVIVFGLDDLPALNRGFERSVTDLLLKPRYRQKFGGHVKMLNLAPLLQPSDYYIMDSHLNAAGHQKVANVLASSMRSF